MIWEDVFNTLYFLLKGHNLYSIFYQREEKMVWVNVLH